MVTLLIFIIILVILFYFATQIKVVHISKLPDDKKNEIENKNKIQGMLKPNYIITTDNQKESFNKTHKKNNGIKNFNKVLVKIRNNFLDDDYEYNIPNLPSNISTKNSKYSKYINREIYLWKMIDNYIKIKEIVPVQILETSKEFLAKTNVCLEYMKKMVYLQTIYYGKVEKDDDPFYSRNKFTVQLVAIREISLSEYSEHQIIENPFMTMDEQMEYVARINKMHANE